MLQNSALITGIHYTLLYSQRKKTADLDWNNIISQYYEINAALVSRRDYVQKHKKSYQSLKLLNDHILHSIIKISIKMFFFSDI